MPSTNTTDRDHGGGIDAACVRFGGNRADWLDLSTGINPVPYPLPCFTPEAWAALPDHAASQALLIAARAFWNVPDAAAIAAAPGASALIARIPALLPPGLVCIPGPTYNEHTAAFRAQGWNLDDAAQTRVLVHPNNPDGRLWSPDPPTEGMLILDESFCDVAPDRCLIAMTANPRVIVLKSFGKFWGLAGLRLGFAIGDPALIARLSDLLGPWPVSGPALAIGTAALSDQDWAARTRRRLAADATRLDTMLIRRGVKVVGGTPLFRLYDTPDAVRWQAHLGHAQIWTRVFPYSATWLRLGLPGDEADWARLDRALEGIA